MATLGGNLAEAKVSGEVALIPGRQWKPIAGTVHTIDNEQCR